jgi:hypothetical protein
MLCLAMGCCTELQGCANDLSCGNLLVCIDHCAGDATCINTCNNSYPTGTSLYQTLSSCSQSHCGVCAELGTGDPCGALSASACSANLTCNMWCTRTCNQDSDCNGLGPNGGNYLGRPNACIHPTGGLQYCAPGCDPTMLGDCTGFPGTICRTATDVSGATVSVCGSASDAATE